MMKPDLKIPPQNWMSSQEVSAIFDALRDNNHNLETLFVGGCVRNALLDMIVTDIDLATMHKPDEVIRRLEEKNIKVVPTGLDHGTVTAVINGKEFEITTLRKDVETDGRHAVVQFTQDWKEDARRRDFTINTLLADAEGRVYDPTGQGLGDLDKGTVIFVGNPAQRIAEDYLRVLRFFRFHSSYGRGAADVDALNACAAAADRIKTLSKERVTQELLKLLVTPRAPETIRIMFDHGILTDLFHANFDEKAFNLLVSMENLYGEASVEARLCLLWGMDETGMRNAMDNIALSNVQKRNLHALFRIVDTPIGVKERLYREGRTVGAHSVMLSAALGGIELIGDDLEFLKSWPIPVFPLNGTDLANAGIEPGPAMGEALKILEDWWIECDFLPERQDCLEMLPTLIAQ